MLWRCPRAGLPDLSMVAAAQGSSGHGGTFPCSGQPGMALHGWIQRPVDYEECGLDPSDFAQRSGDIATAQITFSKTLSRVHVFVTRFCGVVGRVFRQSVSPGGLPRCARQRVGYCWQTLLTVICPPLSHRREPAMPMVRAMSGLAAVLQTWPLGDSIGVRQQYPDDFLVDTTGTVYPDDSRKKTCCAKLCKFLNAALSILSEAGPMRSSGRPQPPETARKGSCSARPGRFQFHSHERGSVADNLGPFAFNSGRTENIVS